MHVTDDRGKPAMKDAGLSRLNNQGGRRKIIKALGIGMVGLLISRVISNPILKFRNSSNTNKKIRITVNKSAVKRGKRVVSNV
jgi:hypothetical protein